jgi:hypothetical protein
MKVGTELLEAGYNPFIPHLNHFWGVIFPQPCDIWMAWDNEWLLLCDCLYRLPGYSPGADEEERVAAAHYKPIVHSLEELEGIYGTNERASPVS